MAPCPRPLALQAGRGKKTGDIVTFYEFGTKVLSFNSVINEREGQYILGFTFY